MAVVIAMLRGVNVGGNRKLSMEALRALITGLGFHDAQTYIQSGNVVFRANGGPSAAMVKMIEDGIEKKFGFRCDVVLRTADELRKVIVANPFAGRPEVEAARLLLVFLARPPLQEVREQVLGVACEPEELRMNGREMYIFYPHGMGRPKIPFARFEKMLKCPATGRNLNTVNQLLAMAETLDNAE